MPNTALAFGALVAGGVVLDYGVKAFRGAGSSTTGASTPSTSTGSGSGTSDVTDPTTDPTGSVSQAISRAQALEGTPYVWGGGHVASAFTEALAAIKAGGLDCSGYVSQILGPDGLGVITSPLTTEGLTSALTPGAGQQVTVYINPAEHTIIDLNGTWYAAQDQGTVASQISNTEAQATISSVDMTAYHPNGF